MASIADDSQALSQHKVGSTTHVCWVAMQTWWEIPLGKYKMTNGNINASWMNAKIATCAIAGQTANWLRSQSRIWEGHIVIVSNRFLILPRSRRNASHTRVYGKAALQCHIWKRIVLWADQHSETSLCSALQFITLHNVVHTGGHKTINLNLLLLEKLQSKSVKFIFLFK